MKTLFIYMTLFFTLPLSDFAQNPGFVYVKGKKFMLDGKPFYPVGVNYWAKILYEPDDGTITGFALSNEYSINNCYACNLAQNNDPVCYPLPTISCQDAIKNDIQMFHDNGINAIMLGGFDVDVPDGSTQLEFYINPNDQSLLTSIHVPLVGNQTKLISMISEFLNIVSQVDPGMKVILVVSEPNVIKTTDQRLLLKDYLLALADEFKTNSTLMAYSMVHEAGSRIMDLRKDTVCNMVSYWYDAIKNKDNNHLVTLSVWGAGDVQGWDPAVLGVDFLDFHIFDETDPEPFNDRMNNIFSQFYWINQVTTLPWIIGETGFSGTDWDYTPPPSGPKPVVKWGSDEDKKNYAKQTLDKVRDCGGAGYFWYPTINSWFTNNFGGIFNPDKNATPAADAFLNFNPFAFDVNGCLQPPNYYNFLLYSGNSVSGTVKDQNNNPIENAVVYGWGAGYTCPTQTFTDASGNFNLPANNLSVGCLSNTNNAIIRVSAFSASVVNDGEPFESTYSLAIGTDLNEVVQNITISSSQSENYAARKSIEMSNVTVQSGGNLNAVAGKEIHVGATTHFSYGSHVHLFIGNISPDCNDPSNSLTEWKRLGNSNGNTKPKEKDTVIVLYPETNGIMAIKKPENTPVDIEVVPNPANEKFFIVIPPETGNNHFEVSLLNPAGKILLKQQFYNRQVVSFEASRYDNGIYFLLIKTENGYRTIKKIAIQK